MSHNTETGYVNRHGHPELSAAPSALSNHIDTRRDELIEPDEGRGSVRPVSCPAATTCASDTDEGDYETSSEGVVASKRSGIEIRGMQAKESLCGYFREKSTSLSKLVVLDRSESPIKEELIFDPQHELMKNRLTQKTTYVRDSLIFVPESLAKSKSLPILKNEVPNGVSTNFRATGTVLISKSSSAHKNKMAMIVEKMTPLISSYPLTISGSSANICDRQYEARRLESRMTLPLLCDATPTTMINDETSKEFVAEVTLRETRSNYRRMNRGGAIPTFDNDEGAANLTNDGDLVRNSCSFINSVYFAPNPSEPSILRDDSVDSYRSKRYQRVSSSMQTLLKIDYELSPLQCQYSEIIGKARALGLSNTSFDFDISRYLDQPESFGQSVLSSNVSSYFLDQTFSREDAVSLCNMENRPGLVDKMTSPFASFSVVGKPAPREEASLGTNWLLEKGSNCRQEALDFASRDSSRAFENSNDLGFPSRVGRSASYLPTTNIHASQGETVLRERSRNECVSDNSFQPHRKPNAAIERNTSARLQAWSVHERTSVNPTRVLCRTKEYDSHHRYLKGTVENPRTFSDNFSKAPERRDSMIASGLNHSREWNASRTTCRSSSYTSKSTIVEVTDNDWRIDDNKRMLNKRNSKEHFEILSGDRDSTVMQTIFSTCGDDLHESASSEAQRIAKDDQIASSYGVLEPVEHSVDPNRQISHTISASVCTPQIRVVSVNTEFHATVEKCYTSRAVSPIQDLRLNDATSASTRSPSNVILAARVSSVFIREVRATSSTEVLRTESPSEMSLIDVAKRDDADNVLTSKRTFSSRVSSSSDEDEDAELMRAEYKRVQHVRVPLSKAKEKITIVPIVLTDGISAPPKTADVNFAIPRYVDEVPEVLSYDIVPFSARKSRRVRLPSDNEMPQRRNIVKPAGLSEELANEKSARKTSIRRINHDDLTREDASATSILKSSRRSTRMANAMEAQEQVHELTERPKQRIVKVIPGMRSSPEDFLCDT